MHFQFVSIVTKHLNHRNIFKRFIILIIVANFSIFLFRRLERVQFFQYIILEHLSGLLQLSYSVN